MLLPWRCVLRCHWHRLRGIGTQRLDRERRCTRCMVSAFSNCAECAARALAMADENIASDPMRRVEEGHRAAPGRERGEHIARSRLIRSDLPCLPAMAEPELPSACAGPYVRGICPYPRKGDWLPGRQNGPAEARQVRRTP